MFLLQAGVIETVCESVVRVKMEMGKTGVKGIARMYAGPFPTVGLPRSEVFAGKVRVPMVEFVGGYALPFIAKHVVALRSDRNVPEASETALVRTAPGDKADQGYPAMAWVRYMKPPHSAMQGRPFSRACRMSWRSV